MHETRTADGWANVVQQVLAWYNKGELSLGQLAKRFNGQEIPGLKGNTPEQAQAKLRSKDGKTSEDHH